MKLDNGWEIIHLLDKDGYKVSDAMFGEVVANTPREANNLFYETFYAPKIKEYKQINLDQKRTVQELWSIFRIITNGCSDGLDAFSQRECELIEYIEKYGYSIRELCNVLTEERGAIKFKRFFNDKN